MANLLEIDTVVVNLGLTLGVDDLVYDETIPSIVCNIPVTFHGTITLDKNVVGSTTTIPLVDLTPHSSTVSLIRLTADVANALVLKSYDVDTTLNTSLDSNGNFYTRFISADNFAVGTQIQTVGGVTLAFTGPSLFSCDASGGDITYTLPTLTGGSPSGYKFTFVKIDVSVNTVMIAASGGQSINGVTDVLLTTQWSKVTLVSIVSGGSGYWLSV